MDIHSHLRNLRALNLPASDFVVVSSGALAIRGMREARDLDIIVTDFLWRELIKVYPVTLNDWNVERICLDNDVEILNPSQSIFGDSKIIPLREIFDQADVFDGIKFINLEHLKKIKAKLGREIDLRDIELIDSYLRQNS